MEPAVFDDTMEVASDAGHGHPGNIDDIDIDLDLGQEHVPGYVPEHDDDVLVDDASATASDHPTGEADVTYDADMADGEYVDGEYEEYQQGYYHPDDESAYNNPVDYEAEMEDEYEEDIDAPIPESGFEDTNAKEVEGERETRKTEPGEGQTERENEFKVADDAKSTATEILSRSDQAETEISRAKAVADEDHGVQEYTQPKGPKEFALEEGNEISQGVESRETVHPSESHEKYDEEVEPGLEEDGQGRVQIEPGLQKLTSHESEHQGPEAERQYHPPLGQENKSDTDSYHLVEADDYEIQGQTHEIEKSRPLHPVKVIYQDSEISLFPPGEDDPTETFFLQDEALAYAPIEELMGACRHVLGEHISEDEELILDIESLGLHLPEYSAGRTTTSLVQVIRVYLDLCNNDGITEPEPLYLTLSSRSTFTADLARLVAAAQESKGLSYLTWEDYDIDKAEEAVEHGDEHGGEHGEEHVEERERPLLADEDTTSPAEPHSGHIEPADKDGITSGSLTKSPPPASTAQSSSIKLPKQDLPTQEELESRDAPDEIDQPAHGGSQTENVNQGNKSPQNAEEYSNSQRDQGEGEGREEVEVYEEDNLENDRDDTSLQPKDDAGYHSPTPLQPMKIPTVDLSRDESAYQQPEDYIQEYEFSNDPPPLETEGQEEIEEGYQESGADLEPQEDHTESHTVSQGNENGSDNHAQSTVNKNVHIEIDLGADDARSRFADNDDGEDLDEGEIFEPGEPVLETENKANAIPLNGEQPTPGLGIKSPAGDAPKTPELTHDLFEIDEDLFKSPMAETQETVAAMDSPTGSPLDETDQEPLSYPSGSEPYPAAKPTLKSSEIDTAGAPAARDFDEPFATNTSDRAVSDTDELARPSPKSTKRSFIDSGMNDVDGSTPDVKRHRPE
ncbi:hypothetical protein ACJ72_03176 [Emergomyces africanus]|uniref:Uncharacterized protein n=1 Tax=Emergomyces africanus TaxID=1955775 RepID=A0A1B7P0C6_9EURO|nr:hypothetical protein ACJ72_03176 [Emergomyces africanus]